jgi:APA family basic amino acid/polyamine antiporter
MVLRLLTGSKVLALVAVGAAAFAGVRAVLPHEAAAPVPPEGLSAVGAFVLALVAVIWTYEGWADGPSIAGEMRDARRDLPRALLIGTLGTTAVYLLVNVAYLRVLGMEGVRASDSVAVDVARVFLGEAGWVAVAVLVLVSTLGSMLGMIIATSRIFFAMGRDRLFFDRVGEVHPRFGTPAVALSGVGLVSALYAAFGTFEGIIRLFVFAATLFLLLNVASVALHRRRRPDAPRPVRMPGYPWTVLVYLIVGAGVCVQLVRENPRDSLAGFGLMLLSVPVYALWIRWRPAPA